MNTAPTPTPHRLMTEASALLIRLNNTYYQTAAAHARYPSWRPATPAMKRLQRIIHKAGDRTERRYQTWKRSRG